jgi:hypothetical protein
MKCVCAEDTKENLVEFANKYGWESYINNNYRNAIPANLLNFIISILIPVL